MSKPKAIDADPEFYHGLTMWTVPLSAQVRDKGIALFDRVAECEIWLSTGDAQRLRDLLNVATARGML